MSKKAKSATESMTVARSSKDYLRSLYDRLSQEWSRDTPKTHGDEVGLPLVLAYAREAATGGRILDVGCGDGFASRLCGTFAAEVVGLDSSPGMIKAARQRSTGFANVRYVLGDMMNLKESIGTEEVFDLCIGLNAVCCMETREELVEVYKQIRGSLRVGGKVAMQIPHPLDGQLLEPSKWLRDEDSIQSYMTEGQLVRRKLRLLDDRWVNVARHHFSLSSHVNAGLEAGLRLERCAEPGPTADMIRRFPDLERDGRWPSVWLTFWSRD